MTISDFAILALSTWYLAYSVAKLSGPFNVFAWLRGKGELFTCIYCVSLWIAIGFALLWFTPARVLVYPFAIAGGGLILHRYTGGFMVQ